MQNENEELSIILRLFWGWYRLWTTLYQNTLVYIRVNNFCLVASILSCVHRNCSRSSQEPLFRFISLKCLGFLASQTASPVIPFELTGQKFFWKGWAEQQRQKFLFWKGKGHQWSLTMEKNIHKRCSNARLGCICHTLKNKIKSYFPLKLARLFYMGYSVCDY